MLGRVSSLDWFISIGLLPVSFAFTGPVAAALGVRATLVDASLLGAAVTLRALFLPGMRDQERADPVGVRVDARSAVASEPAVLALGSSR